jgi:hypothetical protein
MRNVGVLLFALLLLLPVACGGGGGTPMVKITSQNALEVAGNVTGAVRFLGEFEDMLGPFVSVIEDGDGSGTFQCIGGGSGTVVVDDRAPVGTVSAGDTVRITFDGCTVGFEGEAVSLHGGLNFIVAESTDLPVGFDTTVRFTFTNLRMVMLDETMTLNGDLSANRTTTDEIVFTTTASGNSLRVSIQDDVGTTSASISNFAEERIVDDDLEIYTIETSGRLYVSDLGGAVAYETETVLAGNDADPPEEGSMLVTGAAGSSMLFVVLDEDDIELLVDEDGDGTRETTIPTTWSELD